MAKGNRLGVMSGKLGNTVLYAVTNSNNGEKQGERAYRATIKNPKSLGQRMQRIKQAPAVNFYRQLADLLDHSWQGIAYGGRSHAEFMKHALRMTSGFPYVVKGSTEAYPGRYQISSGSLPSILVSSIGDGFTTSLKLYELSIPATFGLFSQALIDGNSFLQDGDQITFVWVESLQTGATANVGAPYVYHYQRIILDTASTAAMADVQQQEGFRLGVSSDNLLFQDYEQEQAIVAAAVILSRAPRLEGGAWQRSSATMFVEPALEAITLSQDALNAALESYAATTSELSSDWYLNQGDEQAAPSVWAYGPGLYAFDFDVNNNATAFAVSPSSNGFRVQAVGRSVSSDSLYPVVYAGVRGQSGEKTWFTAERSESDVNSFIQGVIRELAERFPKQKFVRGENVIYAPGAAVPSSITIVK